MFCKGKSGIMVYYGIWVNDEYCVVDDCNLLFYGGSYDGDFFDGF